MVVVGSDLGLESETENLMEDNKVVLDVEEGEISDSGSVEEISAEDFKKEQEGSSESKPPRVWTMKELYDYPGFRTGWHNLAWARGLQNQPLNGVVVVDVDQKPPERVVIDDSGDEDVVVVVKEEEGELEEGEIDFDSEPVCEDLDSIRAVLRSVDSVNAEQSFEEVCLRIHKSLEGLRLDEEDDEVARLLFSALRVVFSVFSSMKPIQKDEKKEALSRLLSSVTNFDPPILSTEMLKEIESMIASLSSNDEEKESKEQTLNMEIDLNLSNADNSKEQQVQEQEQVVHKWPSVASVIHSKPVITVPEVSRVGVPSFKGRGLVVPLLDLHKDHDEDSLPSPTRDAPPSFPVARVTPKSGLPHYETDAFKAVSSYQQKFSQNSFMMSDMLPSPTPSDDESEEDEDNNSNNEISGLRTAGPTISRPFLVASVPSTSTITTTTKPLAKSRDPRLRFANADLGPASLEINQKPLTTVQNNTPATIETSEHTNSRKQRAGVELDLEGPASKRRRHGFANASGVVSDIKSVSGSGVNNGNSRPPQVVNKTNAKLDPRRAHIALNSPHTSNAGKEQPATTTAMMASTSNSLPGFLKDIAGNPETLLNILREHQQRLTQPMSDPSTKLPTSTFLSGSAPLVSIPPLKASEIFQPPAGSASATPQAGPVRTQDDALKVRMKPRDPRRVLHGNAIQKTSSLVNEQQIKTPADPTITNKDSQKNMQDGQADKTNPIPDIARQFTKNLRNLADMIPVASPSPAVLEQNLSSQSAQVKPSVKASESNNTDEEQNGSASTAELSESRAPNTWGDVEHLFKGYDDKQKMAIQRERERRLEEQNKMFEARKLCLVLDLDHTLLNSAKFVEVDLVHDEILRKKEEQDRDKPQRHLYRLPHMGMWTKLRPGIWNFLEKASKLFEMHLYTMGNKLYATEMAKVLDPKGTLFSGRVISKGDDDDNVDRDERLPKTKDLEGVMGMESSVLIIDDSVRVWPHNKLNLIVVERYTYFPCSRRQFGLPGPSLLEIDHDERPEDGTLASSLGVIERIHEKFFSSPSLDEEDVRNILALEQQKILAGCRIVFSRVFPVAEVNPHLHPLWQTAQQFGAVCTTQIDDKVTHVVAHSPGTDKVNWAFLNGRFVVHPGWVEASALLYRRANEQDFAIKPAQP